MSRAAVPSNNEREGGRQFVKPQNGRIKRSGVDGNVAIMDARGDINRRLLLSVTFGGQTLIIGTAGTMDFQGDAKRLKKGRKINEVLFH